MESIKRMRKRLGMTLAEVAAGAGMLPEAIARAERAGTDLKASTIALIARAMKVPVCELFEDSGHGRKRKKKA